MANLTTPIIIDWKVIEEYLEQHDIVEVVRCKDCKYSEHWYGDKRRCFLWNEEGIDVFCDGFCNYAGRITDD